MIPGLEQAEFARYGVMHRNTFINAPHLLDASLQLKSDNANKLPIPLFVAGQFGGTEGYCEAIASGLWVALGVCAYLKGESLSPLPKEMCIRDSSYSNTPSLGGRRGRKATFRRSVFI